mmetsp:Transcript_29386/g.68013  ORF Transcript_29386/g.68013 Transcript_29386/m.68013 type:complete len:130 (-) Transcript_29386:507-896(-)
MLTIGISLLDFLLLTVLVSWDPLPIRLFAMVLFAGLNAQVLVIFFRTMVQTRKAIRDAYSIPEGRRLEGYEDLVVSVFCLPCALSQMGRHTADYDTYRSTCCSETGLPNHVDVPPLSIRNRPIPPGLGP